MRNIDEYLFTGHSEIQPGVYISSQDFFWTFLSAGRIIEEGICDWWYDVAAEYPNETIVIEPVDTDVEMLEINPDTIYRGSWELDESPHILCRYAVIEKGK